MPSRNPLVDKEMKRVRRRFPKGARVAQKKTLLQKLFGDRERYGKVLKVYNLMPRGFVASPIVVVKWDEGGTAEMSAYELRRTRRRKAVRHAT